MPADEAIEFLRDEGQLDEWTAAALGHEEALAYIRREEGLMLAEDGYPHEFYCDLCFTTW